MLCFLYYEKYTFKYIHIYINMRIEEALLGEGKWSKRWKIK